MKMKYISLILMISATVLFAADNYLSSFTAKSDGEEIKVEWNSINEDDVSTYEIERSSGNNIYKKIASVKAKGKPAYYKYVDDEAFMKTGQTGDDTQSRNLFSYRIKIVKKDQNYVYSDETYVVHDLNNIRRTWGMIKEMFR